MSEVVFGGTSNREDKFNDEFKFERDESFDFYVSVTCHTRNLSCACAHLSKNNNCESFLEQVHLIEYMWYLFKIGNYSCIRITCLCN